MIAGIWTSIYGKLPLHGALRVLHGYGWRAFDVSTEHLSAIELDDDPQARIKEARQCLHDLDLTAPQAHGLLRANVADADADKRKEDIRRLLRHIEIAAALGVRNIVMHPGGQKGCTTRADEERIRQLNVEAYRRLAEHAAKHDVRIGIENMMGRGASTPADLFRLLEAIDHPAIGFTVDTSHAHALGLDVAAVVRELGPHLVATHISDNDGSGDQHRAPGLGRIDWPAVMEAFGDTVTTASSAWKSRASTITCPPSRNSGCVSPSTSQSGWWGSSGIGPVETAA